MRQPVYGPDGQPDLWRADKRKRAFPKKRSQKKGFLSMASEDVDADLSEIDVIPTWMRSKRFSPEIHCMMAYSAAAAGECDAGIAAALQISEERLSQWVAAHEILAEVIAQGRAVGKREFMELGRQGITAGPLFNQRGYEFQGHQRFGLTGPSKSVAVVDNTPARDDAQDAMRSIGQVLDGIIETATRRSALRVSAAVADESDSDD